MTLTVFSVLMVFITMAALAANQTVVAVLAFILLMTGWFVYRHQSHPAVREWLEKYF